MDINMVFMLSSKFRVAKEEVAQMFLGPKEAMFEKPEESSQHIRPLYVQGHIDGRMIFRMLIDGGVVVNIMSYSVFKKLGMEDDELVKTNLTLNSMWGGGGQPNGGQWRSLHRAHHMEQVARYRILHRRGAR
jgi:hypothetical protein